MNRVKEYYLDKRFNCAESVLRAANEEFQLGLDEKALVTAGGFGGGMASGSSCGALCGAIQALGAAMLEEGRAADCDGFRDLCGQYHRAFEEALGSTMCREIKPEFSDVRCLRVVETAYELLRNQLNERLKQIS